MGLQNKNKQICIIQNINPVGFLGTLSITVSSDLFKTVKFRMSSGKAQT